MCLFPIECFTVLSQCVKAHFLCRTFQSISKCRKVGTNSTTNNCVALISFSPPTVRANEDRGQTSSPQICLVHSNKSWNASLIAPNTFIQSLYTKRKIEPLIDNKGSHFGSLLLSFLWSAVYFTLYYNYINMLLNI